jgi:SSS family solute:Na+ symporter
MQTWVVATTIIGLYLVVVMVLGVAANQRLTVDLEDFLLYGRKVGFFVLYFTVVATFHSAFAFLGSCGFFYSQGIGFWAAGTWTILVGAITYVIGTRVWALGKVFGYITPADLLADFYESEAVRVAVAVVSVLFTILYIQVQSEGLGYIVSVASGGRISFDLGTLLLLTVTAAYVMAGGIRAVCWTDVLQGIWMYIAVWGGALWLTYHLFGGPVALWHRLAAERPDLLSLPGPHHYFTPGMWIGMTITLSFGIVFQPHLIMRWYTAVDAKTLKWLGATTPIYLMSLYIPTALVGLGGALVMPHLATPDRIFPELLFRYASPWLTGFTLAGATAAAMSTLAAILHANMTVLTRDIYQRYIAPDRSQAHYVWVGRALLVVLLGVGYVLSIRTSNFLVILVTLSGSGALQLMPGIVGVCFPGGRTLTRAGVLAGLIVGTTSLYVTLVLVPHPWGLQGGIWSLLLNTAVAMGVSAFTEAPSSDTIRRVHGELERFVYGVGEAGRESHLNQVEVMP